MDIPALTFLCLKKIRILIKLSIAPRRINKQYGEMYIDTSMRSEL